ncbi:hypothetical protein MGG_05085 [Pyricularia oryzae 70-15]|uniref:Major facilitator superfamily (MFS) profile domain-containing protein n=1 Tax=Pyricularia oryzae (strain 70-15 / ATCC MYA-4617 / FGSC 8958) TaxID=242507 RepID=G4N479_PYRO7|nr:uncharacterized protein MGG_05085 [Pyricularia oryzae 70-15]EHA52799.1 hypothetical protein MGG_05085 [Pyricularia oryzae 70-15]KAI7917517.1 hypothetical protein M0657_008056 [Pyricularia oryzae]KAI7918926.1 hypothetical protein M9X92_006627 [Pyricularia oryzae]
MGLGILEDRHMDHVPGTTRHYDDPNRPTRVGEGATTLKTTEDGIILVPQPSDDPNDPLNWPLWKRDLITAILSMTAIFATSLGPILAANTITLSLWFGQNLTKIAILTGYFLLGVGAAGTFFVPSSRIWGKRHAFVVGLLILIGSSAWGGAVYKNYDSMVGARIIQGVGAAPYEALVNAAVGDLYFVHQRGKRMAFTNLAVFGGAFFTPILVGVITHSIMWWWTFYIVAILCAACLPLVVFFCPETAYKRDQSLNTDMGVDFQTGHQLRTFSEGSDSPPAQGQSTADEEKLVGRSTQQGQNGAAAEIPKQKTFTESLALFDGRKTDESFWKLLFRPFVLLVAQPAFLWASLIQGTMIGWTVFIGVILGNVFLGPPKWWNEVDTGYAYTGPFLGALVGFAISGGLSDWSARKLTKWNNGVYEPEFRILLTIPQLVLGCASLYGFGATADAIYQNKADAPALLLCFGLEVAAMVIGAVASSLYIVDAYRDLSIEGFTCMIIFKNFFSYALTYKAYDWWLELKTVSTPLFNIIGTVQLVICLTSIPMYIYGKRVRSYYYRHDILAACGLR